MKKRSKTARVKRARRPVPRGKRVAAPRAGRSAQPRARRPATARSGLSLPAECTLAGAESLRQALAALLKGGACVTVDVSGVRRIDSASLQLLAAFTRDRRASGLPIELSGESPAFAECARLLGLAPLLAGTPA